MAFNQEEDNKEQAEKEEAERQEALAKKEQEEEANAIAKAQRELSQLPPDPMSKNDRIIDLDVIASSDDPAAQKPLDVDDKYIEKLSEYLNKQGHDDKITGIDKTDDGYKINLSGGGSIESTPTGQKITVGEGMSIEDAANISADALVHKYAELGAEPKDVMITVKASTPEMAQKIEEAYEGKGFQIAPKKELQAQAKDESTETPDPSTTPALKV